ncbi:CoxG family protein [Kitasatospora sp. NPDC008050]|uniref:CoxG family protein n=1 Tax=Kitasatospora sp. NPDC008050 TaxID=3364021 RepID=UPI0036EBCFE6
MEHEVVIQLPAELVQPALADPALLARCVPGLSTDASDAPERRTGAKRPATDGPEEINGRLRLRIGGSTITYRGVVSLIRSGGSGVLTAFLEGQEARGDGEVLATVRLRVETDGADGVLLRFSGDLTPGGRLAEIDDETLATTGRRLLDRFAAALAVELGGAHAPILTVVPDEEADESDQPPAEDTDGPTTPDDTPRARSHDIPDELPDDLFSDDLSGLIAFSSPDSAEPLEAVEAAGSDEGTEPDEAAPSDPDTGAEPLDPAARLEVPYGYPRAVEDPLGSDDLLAGPVRRSIVGRSAEEVDHAPPRGRYAPTLPARSARARAASRWYGDQHAAAPVAARGAGRLSTPWMIGGGVALLGGAVIVARALRRR